MSSGTESDALRSALPEGVRVMIAPMDRDIRTCPGPSALRAAAMIVLAWLPLVVAAASLPRFVPVYDRWRSELPPLTATLMSVGRLGAWPIVLVGAGLVAVLVGLYVGWVRAGLPGRRGLGLAFSAAGLGAFAVCLLGALWPLFMFRIP